MIDTMYHTNKANDVRYVQYVYHFEWPVNSIDVRIITDKEMKFIKDLYNILINPNDSISMNLFQTSTEHNIKQAERILREHFPEELI